MKTACILQFLPEFKLRPHPTIARLTLSSQNAINARFALCAGVESLFSTAHVQTPTRPNSNSPLKVCGGSVFGIPATESLVARTKRARAWDASPED
jgi:hypothetical protein